MEKQVVRKNGVTTSLDNLPPEMVINILLRLPVKTLITSTSVSKTWYTLITDPTFISAQISRSISCRNQNAVLVVPTNISNHNHCSLISADTGFVFDTYEIPFKTCSETLQLVDSLNGLLLLTDVRTRYRFRDLYLSNPCVKKYVYLDNSYYNKLCNKLAKHCTYSVGLGFSEPDRDYRVVRILYYKNNRIGKWPPRAEIFSMRMKEWREIKNPVVARVFSEIGVTVDSCVYWTSEGIGNTGSHDMWILSFDFNNEVFVQFKLPDNVRYCLSQTATFRLMKFEGLLSVCVFSFDFGSDGRVFQPCCIWLMRHEDGIISWTLRFRVAHSKLGSPLKITDGGTLLMLLLLPHPEYHDAGLLSCNLKSMHYKYLGFNDPSDEMNFVTASVDTSFIESLVMHVEEDEPLKSAKDVPDPTEFPGVK